MIFPELDRTTDMFVTAMIERDHARIRGVMADDAVLTCEGMSYRSDELDAWKARFLPSGNLQILPIKATMRGADQVLTVIVSTAAAGAGEDDVSFQMDWKITLGESRILALDIGPKTLLRLPNVILSYIRAMNTLRLDLLLETFADDALVNDQLRDYWGKSAIAEWANREIIGDRVTMAVTKIVEHYGTIIITANVDGDFDKRGLPDPLVLAFYFSANGDKIVQLIILRNMADM